MKYRCQKGCKRPGSPFALWHATKAECPYEPEYRGPPEKKPDVKVETKPGEAKPEAAQKKPGLLSFGSKPASVSSRTAPATQPVEEEWEVDAEHSLDAFSLLDNLMLRLVNFFDRLLGAKKGTDFEPFEGHLILNNAADEQLVQKKMGRRIVTRFTKFMGAKNREEAHAIIESGGVILLLGAMFFSIGSHVLAAWNHSPVLKKWKENRKAEKEKAKEEARKRMNVPPAPEVPALPAPT